MRHLFIPLCILLFFCSLPFLFDKKEVCFSSDHVVVSSQLIAGLESYRSPQEIRAGLAKGLSWEVIKESRLEEGDTRPPFGLSEVSIKNFSHLNFHGELRLIFFNDRLMSTIFYPVDFQQYFKALTEIQKLRFKKVYYKQKEAIVAPYVRILAPTDDYIKEFNGKLSITWEDIRLINERDDWLMKYS